MMYQLSAQQSDSLRTAGRIDREMAVAHSERFSGITTVISYYTKYDTLPDSTYALIHFLADSLPDVQWKRTAIGLAVRADTVSWARSILDSLELKSADDSTAYDYHDLAISLKEDTLTWFDVDSTQRALIDTMAAGISSVKYRAQAVQMLLDDTVFVRIPEQLPGTSSGRYGQEEPEEDIYLSDAKVEVYPNPFSNQFTVSYTLSDTVSKIVFEVFDLTGRVILRENTVNTTSGVQVLNIGECKGMYLLRVTADNRVLRTEKIICINR